MTTRASRVPWTLLFSRFPQTFWWPAIILNVSSIFLPTTRREKSIWNENLLFRIALPSSWDPSFWNQIPTFVKKHCLSIWSQFSKRFLLRRTSRFISETLTLFCWARALVLLNTLKIPVPFRVSKSKTRNSLFLLYLLSRFGVFLILKLIYLTLSLQLNSNVVKWTIPFWLKSRTL